MRKSSTSGRWAMLSTPTPAHNPIMPKGGNLVFYHYDFVDGTSQLNARGQDKLAKLGMYLPTTFAPIVVERTPKEPGLDESRRLALVKCWDGELSLSPQSGS